jgi:hypothetical protein
MDKMPTLSDIETNLKVLVIDMDGSKTVYEPTYEAFLELSNIYRTGRKEMMTFTIRYYMETNSSYLIIDIDDWGVIYELKCSGGQLQTHLSYEQFLDLLNVMQQAEEGYKTQEKLDADTSV